MLHGCAAQMMRKSFGVERDIMRKVASYGVILCADLRRDVTDCPWHRERSRIVDRQTVHIDDVFGGGREIPG